MTSCSSVQSTIQSPNIYELDSSSILEGCVSDIHEDGWLLKYNTHTQ